MKVVKFRISIIQAVAIIFLASVAASAQAYGGRAIGIYGSVTVNGSATSFTFADSGELPVTGGTVASTVTASDVPGVVTSGLLSANSSGALSSSQSVTAVNDVVVRINGVLIEADRVRSNSGCICCPLAEFGSCSGSVSADVLRITDTNGTTTSVGVTGVANQVVNLPNGAGTLTINEQIFGKASITVNGLRVQGPAGGPAYNVVVASSTSFLECASAFPTPSDVTISGRVLSSAGGAIARATVKLTDSSGTVQTVVTNSFGNYSLTGVKAGSYVMTVTARGYSFQPVVINANEDATVDIVAQ